MLTQVDDITGALELLERNIALASERGIKARPQDELEPPMPDLKAEVKQAVFKSELGHNLDVEHLVIGHGAPPELQSSEQPIVTPPQPNGSLRLLANADLMFGAGAITVPAPVPFSIARTG